MGSCRVRPCLLQAEAYQQSVRSKDHFEWLRLSPRRASASLLANSKPLRTQPIVYGAETDLGFGRFTYVLTIEDGRLYVHAENDKD